jgi:hypothetical protein
MTGFVGVQKHPRFRVTADVELISASGDVRPLPLEDISLGGVFIRTTAPEAPGSFVRLRLPSGGVAATVVGRVVHVIDGPASVAKARAPGMGVQFDGLSPDTHGVVRAFVDALVERERVRRATKHPARFVDATHVEVWGLRSVLAELWPALSRGELRAHGAARIGSRVAIVFGPLTLSGDVVGADVDAQGNEAGGMVLRVRDFTGVKREAVRRFVDGETDGIVLDSDSFGARMRVDDVVLEHVLGDARRLFDGIEADDGLSAIGLPDDAGSAEVTERTSMLLARFRTPQPHASKPQAARLEAAVGALLALEPTLLAQLLDRCEARGAWIDAARAGEALLRLRHGDLELHARVCAIVDRARAS